MANAISNKSTKTELLKAYEELLQQVQETKKHNLKLQKDLDKKQETVAAAEEIVPDSIVRNLTDLKMAIGKQLDSIADEIVSERKKLANIQQAIEVESQRLKENHEINSCADTLQALLLGQNQKREQFEDELKIKRERFETEMTEKRQLWEKEQERVEQSRNEEIESLQKTRQREQEEYDYQLHLTRQKDMDQYEVQKSALEKELTEKRFTFEQEFSERKKAIENSETELNELREKVGSFPETLEKVTHETIAKVTQELETKYNYEKEIRKCDVDGQINLDKQTIASLNEKIKEQQSRIDLLANKSSHANQQVQDIAIKAIESSSLRNAFNFDKHGEVEAAKSEKRQTQ